ncbi:MAG: Fe-S cluster assembly protein HesB [Actinomycetota bacterium]|jgi:3-methyladenine DNA glycosylase/8-oxoguanine DNA glycosylase|nr:Fe-S cluster assembly protein HesB [Actinomycetota bacterium]
MDGRDLTAETGWRASFALTGPGGEPVDLVRTFRSHGLAALPPMHFDEGTSTLEATLPVQGYAPRTVLIQSDGPERGLVGAVGPAPDTEEGEGILRSVRHVLRLDEDLSPFYGLAAGDPELAWVTRGAGRMVRGATAFEDVVKTLCTTNCAWSATTRMIGALVEHLGEKAHGAPETGPSGRAFPTPEAMAAAGEDFYKDVVRAGYRGRYLLALSRSVVEGTLDLEALDASVEELSDEELERRLLALPGVGPYAAAHIMTMLGRYSRLVLDSWTRPTYARLSGRDVVSDGEIVDRFSPYGGYAGLAFWLYLTRGWIEDAAEEAVARER